jgi:uncharacterized protein (DUF1810 family)
MLASKACTTRRLLALFLGAPMTSDPFNLQRFMAKSYVHHPLLGFRLRECTQLVNGVVGRSIEDIFGYPDNKKFHSSMTLFAHVHPSEKSFMAALTKYFNGEVDQGTLGYFPPTGVGLKNPFE